MLSRVRAKDAAACIALRERRSASSGKLVLAIALCFAKPEGALILPGRNRPAPHTLGYNRRPRSGSWLAT